MADAELGPEIIGAVLAWISKQKLESVAVLGLLALFQAKFRGVEIPVPRRVSSTLRHPA
jgi:hypothetical protein